MKRLLYILTALVLFQCGSTSNLFFAHKKPSSTKIDARFLPYFKILDSIYKKNDIVIDYKKVSSITDIDSIPKPLGYSVEGVYNKVTKIVYINTDQFDAFMQGHYVDMMVLILAHEIAHSQGKEHSSDINSIMYPSSTYTFYLLEQCTVEELVTEIYTKDYPILKE